MDALMLMNSIASNLHSGGNLASAEPFCRDVLAGANQIYGKEDPISLNAMGSLASLLQDKGDFVGAEVLYRGALALQRRVLGNDDPDTYSSQLPEPPPPRTLVLTHPLARAPLG